MADERTFGYINAIPFESTPEREARHARVAERRAQHTLLLVHRGATRFAPENTIKAYAAAMDRGADGFEIDIRRTKDGVLYMFHDDTLDRMTNGTGKVSDLTYYELLKVAREDATPPTLAAVIELARQRDALLHLDIKEEGIEDDIIRMFDEADAWDHIVHINPYNSDKIRSRSDLELYDYKGWISDHIGWLKDTGADLSDPKVYESFLSKPGKMVFTKDDPAEAVQALQREDAADVPLPNNIRAWWGPKGVVGVE
jgi:hypothetical protein